MNDQVAIFGDVHGESKMLERLIEEIHQENKDIELYSVGDLIDRGPDSAGVIDLCIKHNIKGIMGNHELWLRNLVRDRVFDSFALEKIMGGKFTFESYNIFDFKNPNAAALELLNNIPSDHKKFLIGLPDYRSIEVDGHKYWLLHAGLTRPSAVTFRPLNQDTSDQEMMEYILNTGKPENFIMWNSPNLGNRFRPENNLFQFENATQVFGHKPVKEPIVSKKFIALDTGCGTCGPYTLTAILLPSMNVVQVKESNRWAD